MPPKKSVEKTQQFDTSGSNAFCEKEHAEFSKFIAKMESELKKMENKALSEQKSDKRQKHVQMKDSASSEQNVAKE